MFKYFYQNIIFLSVFSFFISPVLAGECLEVIDFALNPKINECELFYTTCQAPAERSKCFPGIKIENFNFQEEVGNRQIDILWGYFDNQEKLPKLTTSLDVQFDGVGSLSFEKKYFELEDYIEEYSKNKFKIKTITRNHIDGLLLNFSSDSLGILKITVNDEVSFDVNLRDIWQWKEQIKILPNSLTIKIGKNLEVPLKKVYTEQDNIDPLYDSFLEKEKLVSYKQWQEDSQYRKDLINKLVAQKNANIKTNIFDFNKELVEQKKIIVNNLKTKFQLSLEEVLKNKTVFQNINNKVIIDNFYEKVLFLPEDSIEELFEIKLNLITFFDKLTQDEQLLGKEGFAEKQLLQILNLKNFLTAKIVNQYVYSNIIKEKLISLKEALLADEEEKIQEVITSLQEINFTASNYIDSLTPYKDVSLNNENFVEIFKMKTFLSNQGEKLGENNGAFLNLEKEINNLSLVAFFVKSLLPNDFDKFKQSEISTVLYFKEIDNTARYTDYLNFFAHYSDKYRDLLVGKDDNDEYLFQVKDITNREFIIFTSYLLTDFYPEVIFGYQLDKKIKELGLNFSKEENVAIATFYSLGLIKGKITEDFLESNLTKMFLIKTVWQILEKLGINYQLAESEISEILR